jgi:hypothetical protein
MICSRHCIIIIHVNQVNRRRRSDACEIRTQRIWERFWVGKRTYHEWCRVQVTDPLRATSSIQLTWLYAPQIQEQRSSDSRSKGC